MPSREEVIAAWEELPELLRSMIRILKIRLSTDALREVAVRSIKAVETIQAVISFEISVEKIRREHSEMERRLRIVAGEIGYSPKNMPESRIPVTDLVTHQYCAKLKEALTPFRENLPEDQLDWDGALFTIKEITDALWPPESSQKGEGELPKETISPKLIAYQIEQFITDVDIWLRSIPGITIAGEPAPEYMIRGAEEAGKSRDNAVKAGKIIAATLLKRRESARSMLTILNLLESKDDVQARKDWQAVKIELQEVAMRLRLENDAVQVNETLNREDVSQEYTTQTVISQYTPILSQPKPVDDGAKDSGTSKMSLEARAMAQLVEHPDWSNKAIAKAIGCHPKSLNRCKKFMEARAMLRKQGQDDLPNGSKYPDAPMESWDNDSEDDS